MTELSLFPDLSPSVEERARLLDLEIELLLFGKPGGPLKLNLSDDEKQVLRAIRFHRGADRAITIRQMRDLWVKSVQLSERQVKNAVRTLRIDFRLPIGSSKKGSDGGYFLMLTEQDHAILHKQVLDQVRAELEVLKAVDGPRAALELLGQLQIEVDAMEVA
jgi:hypothetical protein